MKLNKTLAQKFLLKKIEKLIKKIKLNKNKLNSFNQWNGMAQSCPNIYLTQLKKSCDDAGIVNELRNGKNRYLFQNSLKTNGMSY
ncbi:hypothetical protein BpHYR1_027797 [Brachionus plicatilis]|uniref:Uncharacterized protein n=1 Tax=Brachionus plicatilis TaxID=10195 RepID=A0A3M7PFM0_BRAPC|nr:hypothetical protein BpHYR1_027797 [Brachionus plicatilis]